MAETSKPTQFGARIRGVLRWEDLSGRREFFLHMDDTIQIGREEDNHIILATSEVSRRHAVIAWRNAAFEIQDLGSTNGTLVNGDLADRPCALQDGDTIRLGDVEFEFFTVQPSSPQPELEPIRGDTLVVPSDAPRPRLIITSGPQEGREIPIRIGKMVFGRATSKASWDVALQDRSVSRPHAQLEYQDDQFILTDLDSANCTLVNGEIVTEAIFLRDGDVIELGETMLLFRAS